MEESESEREREGKGKKIKWEERTVKEHQKRMTAKRKKK